MSRESFTNKFALYMTTIHFFFFLTVKTDNTRFDNVYFALKIILFTHSINSPVPILIPPYAIIVGFNENSTVNGISPWYFLGKIIKI